MKRLFDILFSIVALTIAAPILIPIILLIFLEDRHSPFYIAPRVGRKIVPFDMLKLRSMIVDAHIIGASSTSNHDPRITRMGGFIRRYKVDEILQFWNVLLGNMSIVGPRPQVPSGVDLYTDEEKRLLDVRPGITDFSSIVFSDEGDILGDKDDPDLAYNQLIRPWKSRLGLVYVDNSELILDIQLIYLTALAVVNRQRALDGVFALLKAIEVEPVILEVARRDSTLTPFPPPGSDTVFQAN